MHATVAVGTEGIERALSSGDLPVIVDVLRFSSTVTTAIANGFSIVPAATQREAAELARTTGAAVSGPTGKSAYSLSPLDYLNPRSPEEVILVSPNGAALSLKVNGDAFGFIGCFLNARTAGRLLKEISERTHRGIVLIAAGEAAEDLDRHSESRRFAIEDYLGCGCLLSELHMDQSSEAIVCQRAYEACRQDFADLIRDSMSGSYLVRKGLSYDISHCVQRSIYDVLPLIREGRIIRYEEP